MTFCGASARGQQFERSIIPCKQPLSLSRMHGGLAAGPVSVRREADAQADCAREKDLQMQVFSEAADGIRTHDLLHGKQNVGEEPGHKPPAKCGFWPACAVTMAREFTPIHDGLGTEWGPGRETRVDSARPMTCAARHAPAPSLGVPHVRLAMTTRRGSGASNLTGRGVR
jgi:hypothetical protein